MASRLSKPDFCESCLKIGCGNDRSMTVKEILESPGYAQPLGPSTLNYTILYGLEDNGGCAKCKSVAENSTSG